MREIVKMVRNLDLNMIKEPEIKIVNGKKVYYDYITKGKTRPAFPEEKVRQKFIRYLIQEKNVPSIAIKVEEPTKHYANVNRRMDIVIERDTIHGSEPVAVVECKAESVILSEQVYEQAEEYANTVNIPIIIVTNGRQIECLKRTGDKCEYIINLPTYEEMENYSEIKTEPKDEYTYNRWNYDDLYLEDVQNIEKNLGKPCLS